MRIQNSSVRSLMLFLFFTGIVQGVAAQDLRPYDSTFYVPYPDALTTRIYLSQKYVNLNFPEGTNDAKLGYRANTSLNLGAGFTWRSLTINIDYGFAALNRDLEKGTTKGLDIQMNIFPRNWAINLNVILPSGFHLEPRGYASSDLDAFYYRHDIAMQQLGLSAYYVQNKARFSYRAALLQTEWQKRSAGSFLFGGNIFSVRAMGDSALVPAKLQSRFPAGQSDLISAAGFGPGAGYAYTLVLGGHFFMTGSLTGNLNFCITRERTGSYSNNRMNISPATNYKAALGYNSAKWNVSANWTGSGIWFEGNSTNRSYFWPVGHYRVVIARRIPLKHAGKN